MKTNKQEQREFILQYLKDHEFTSPYDVEFWTDFHNRFGGKTFETMRGTAIVQKGLTLLVDMVREGVLATKEVNDTPADIQQRYNIYFPAAAKKKLSALIREGARLLPKARDVYFAYDPKENPVGSCALGAAYHAWNGEPIPARYWEGEPSEAAKIEQMMTACGIDETPPPPPVEFDTTAKLSGVVSDPDMPIPNTVGRWVAFLNDDAKWKREKIADWLESIGY